MKATENQRIKGKRSLLDSRELDIKNAPQIINFPKSLPCPNCGSLMGKEDKDDIIWCTNCECQRGTNVKLFSKLLN